MARVCGANSVVSRANDVLAESTAYFTVIVKTRHSDLLFIIPQSFRFTRQNCSGRQIEYRIVRNFRLIKMISVKIDIFIADGIETGDALFDIFAFFADNNKNRIVSVILKFKQAESYFKLQNPPYGIVYFLLEIFIFPHFFNETCSRERKLFFRNHNAINARINRIDCSFFRRITVFRKSRHKNIVGKNYAFKTKITAKSLRNPIFGKTGGFPRIDCKSARMRHQHGRRF